MTSRLYFPDDVRDILPCTCYSCGYDEDCPRHGLTFPVKRVGKPSTIQNDTQHSKPRQNARKRKEHTSYNKISMGV